MSNKTEKAIQKAREEIEAQGYEIEEHINNGECHLVLTRGDERRGWGWVDRLYAWTEAYEAVTGKSWTSL